MIYQLETHIAQQLKDFFDNFDFIDKVVIFGSRAKHTANPKSDIDLCIYSLEMSDEQFSKLRFELDELPILYKLDIVHFEKVNKELQDNVEKDGKILYYKSVQLSFLENKEYISVKKGKQLPKDCRDKGNIPVIGAGKVSPYFSSKSNFGKNTITISSSGANAGYVWLHDCPIWASDCSVINVNKNIDLKYLYYFFKAKQEYIYSFQSGAGQPHVYWKDIKTLEILFPTLTKQKKIANVLDRANELITLRKESIEKLDKLSKSIFIDMFGDPVLNPKGWDIEIIENLVQKEKYSIKRGPFGGSLKKDIFVKEGYLVYEQYHALNNDFSFGRYFIDEKKYQELKAFEVKAGDIIISCSGVYLGKLAIIPNNFQKGIINQALLKISLDEKKMNNIFYINIFTNANFKKKFFGNNNGSGIPNFPSMVNFKKFKFISPPISLQNKFANIIEKIEEQKVLYEQQLKLLEDNFNSLLQRSFS